VVTIREKVEPRESVTVGKEYAPGVSTPTTRTSPVVTGLLRVTVTNAGTELEKVPALFCWTSDAAVKALAVGIPPRAGMIASMSSDRPSVAAADLNFPLSEDKLGTNREDACIYFHKSTTSSLSFKI
jgi:hypothetical protein